MRKWKRLLIPTMAICLLSPAALWAEDVQPEAIEEVTPTFQNAAQAQRAANLANSSFTEEDMEEARHQAEAEATDQIGTLSTDYADGVVDQISSDSAYQEVKQLSRDHAINSVDTEEFPNLDARAALYADGIVEKKAHEYALSVADGDRTKYQEAYDAALARATDPSFHNAWDTAYQEAIAKALEDDFTNWQEAYDYAIARATNPDYPNAYDTAYDSAKKQAIESGVWQDAYDYAIARATNPDYPNAYQAEYKKALEAAVADITGRQLQEIHQMRYVEKLGWGVITRKRLGLHASHNGLGNKWKHQIPPSLDDEIIPPGPTEPYEISFEKEIAEVTRRNTITGWDDYTEFQATGKKNKGPRKEYGLAQTSGLASEDIRGKRNGSKGNGQNKSNFGNSGKSNTSSGTEAVASNNSKSNNGNNTKGSSSNDNKGGNGNTTKGGSSSNDNKGGSGNTNKGGNSSNGNKGGSSNDNKGGNGNSNKGGNSNNSNKGGNGKKK